MARLRLRLASRARLEGAQGPFSRPSGTSIDPGAFPMLIWLANRKNAGLWGLWAFMKLYPKKLGPEAFFAVIARNVARPRSFTSFVLGGYCDRLSCFYVLQRVPRVRE